MKKLLAITLSFMLVFAGTSVACAEEGPELIAYWNFDELSSDNTVEDLSGNGNDLILQDPSYNIVKGYTGNTFDFNGGTSAYDNSKHLAIDSDKFVPQINGSSAVTITAVMKKEVKGSSTNFTMLALNAGSNSIMWYVQAAKMATASRSNYNGAAMATSAEVVFPNIDDSTSPDGWMHVALVVDYANDNVKFYADGILVGEERAEATPQKYATDVASYKTDVGDITKGWFGVGGRHVLVDDVRVYTGAMDEDEIRRSVPPVLEYEFEDAEGGTVADLGVNGMDISVSGGEIIDGATGNTLKLGEQAFLPVCTLRGMLYGAYQQSVSCWLRLDEGRLPVANQTIFADAEQGGIKLEVTPAGAVVFSGKSSAGDGVRTVSTEGGIFAEGDSSWRHIYGDFDYKAKTGRIYINGILVAEASLPFASNYYNMGGLGSNADYVDLCTDASFVMDSLKFYRRSLSDGEISSLAEAVPMVKAKFNENGSSATASCTVTNLTAGDIAEGKMALILCAYDKDTNRMVNASMVNLPAIAKYRGLDNQNISVDIDGDPADYLYRLFAWHGIDGVASYQDEIVYSFD